VGYTNRNEQAQTVLGLNQGREASVTKRPYTPPRLIRYGDATQLTAVKSAPAKDGAFSHFGR